MSSTEITLIVVLGLLVAAPLYIGFTTKDKTVFWNPLTIFATVFAYYFLIGPLIALSTGNTIAYEQNFRDVMWKPWLAGVVGLGSIYAGFAIPVFKTGRKYSEIFDDERRIQVRKFCFILFGLGMVGFAYFAIATGRSPLSILNPIAGASANTGSDQQAIAAGNYLFLLINTFIPALCMWYALNADKPVLMRLLLVGFPVMFVVFFYTTLGFRHRIVILSLALSATAYLTQRKRPNPGTLLLGVIGLLFGAGLIVLSRSYGQGLDLSLVSGVNSFEIFLSGFNDCGTFFTLALVMDSMPQVLPFFGFQSLWVALTIPIPRALWLAKPEPDYLWAINDLAGTQGQAVPLTGEHYMMAGWFGIIIGGLLVGIIYRGFWNFYRANPSNPIVMVIYAVSFGLCFPLINRGYLAQALMEYFFALMPLVVLFWLFRSDMALPETAPAPIQAVGRPLRRHAFVPRLRRPVR